MILLSAELSCMVICFGAVAGLGQVQLKLGELKGSVVNFEKVLEVYPDNCETLKVKSLQAFSLLISHSCILSFEILKCFLCIFISSLGSWAHIHSAWTN